MEELLKEYKNAEAKFRRYLSDAESHLERSAPSTLDGIRSHVNLTEKITSDLKSSGDDLRGLVTAGTIDAEWAASAARASALAASENDRWLAQFSPSRVEMSKEFREDAAAAFNRSRAPRAAAIDRMIAKTAEGSPVSTRDLLKYSEEGLTSIMLRLAELQKNPLEKDAIERLRNRALGKAAGEFVVPAICRIANHSSAKGPRADLAHVELDLGGDRFYDTRHFYDSAHATREGLEPSDGCLDETAVRRARILVRAEADPPTGLKKLEGVGSVHEESLPLIMVRAGGRLSVAEAWRNPHQVAAYAGCCGPILRSHVDARWTEYATTRSEPRASETAPLRALTRSAEEGLAKLSKKKMEWEDVEDSYLSDDWLLSAAHAAYKTSEEAWTNIHADPSERLIAGFAQVSELEAALRPLYAAKFRANVTEAGFKETSKEERPMYLKIRAENALSELAEEISARRSDLLMFREPLALAASGAALD